VKPGDKIVVTGREFQFLDETWKAHKGSWEVVNRSSFTDKMIGLRARRGEKITLEIERISDQ
jgi:hypothetical protein